MATMWGIHNNTSLDLIEGGFVSVGWDELGLLEPPLNREELKARLTAAYPTSLTYSSDRRRCVMAA